MYLLLNKRVFVSLTFFRFVSAESSKHCTFIDDIKMKCSS